MWNIDPHSWTGTTDPNLRNEMLQEDLWHLIQRQNHTRRRQEPSQGGHWTTRWPPLYSQDQETEMVWTCYTSNRTCKHHHAGHSTRREETRQTKEMLARQHQGMDGAAFRQDPETNRGQRRLEEDHQNICGAPTAPQRLRVADADDMSTAQYIHGSLCPRLDVFTAQYVHGSICPRSNISTAGCVHGSICPRPNISTAGCVHGPIYPRLNMSTAQYIHGWMCPRSSISTAQYVHGPIYPRLDVSTAQYIHGSICPLPNMSTAQCACTGITPTVLTWFSFQSGWMTTVGATTAAN